MTERTNQDQEVAIPLELDLDAASHIAKALLQEYPPYTGPKDCEVPLEQNAAHMIRRLVRRLRELSEPKPVPWWLGGLEIKTNDALPRGYIWLHSATEAGDPTKDELNAIIKGVSYGDD